MIIGISGKIGSGKDTVGKIIQYLHTDDEDLKEWFLEEPTKALTKWNGNFDNLGEYKTKKFASKLKDMVCLLLNCTREQLEDQNFKNKELGEEWWYYKIADKILPRGYYPNEVDNQMCEERHLIKLTPRLILQLLGTEAGRNIIHPNIWINALMSEYIPSVYWMCDKCMNDNLTHLTKISSRFDEHETEHVCPNCKGEESEGDITQVINNKSSNWIITDLRFPNELEAIKKKEHLLIRINRPRDENAMEHISEIMLDNCNDWDYVIENNGSIEELVEKVKEIFKDLI